MTQQEPITSFRGKHRFLSNFWPVDVIYDGDAYPSVEHAYQAAKTLNKIWRTSIRRALAPNIAERLGRIAPIREDWDEIKLSIMRGLLQQKFDRVFLRARLLQTGTAELIEGNTWGDTYWGVCRGKGENHLGKLLMEIRDTKS